MPWSDLLLVVLVFLVSAITLTAFLHIVVYRVPFVATPSAVVERMIDVAELQGSETVYDLGAGDGKILIAGKRRCPSITAIGCEVVPTVWLLSKIRVLLSGVSVGLRPRNALRQDLRDADVIFLYVTPELMARLAEKFRRELRPGTRIVSHAFHLPGREPEKVELVNGRKIYVYRW